MTPSQEHENSLLTREFGRRTLAGDRAPRTGSHRPGGVADTLREVPTRCTVSETTVPLQGPSFASEHCAVLLRCPNPEEGDVAFNYPMTRTDARFHELIEALEVRHPESRGLINELNDVGADVYVEAMHLGARGRLIEAVLQGRLAASVIGDGPVGGPWVEIDGLPVTEFPVGTYEGVAS